MPTRGNEQHATSGWNQWFNLLGALRIVHQENRAFALEYRKVKTAQLSFTIGKFGREIVSADNMGQYFLNGQWLAAGALEIKIELRVGIARLELFN